jgi:D-alanine-D-alanine ligase
VKVLVLGGGYSPERAVSLRSAKAVADAARAAGFDVLEADPAGGIGLLDGIAKDTIVLPILHGKNGEDGWIQAQLEKRGLPFLGTGSEASKKCFDKWLTRVDLEAAGIPMPKAERVSKNDYHEHEFFRQPHVLKILHGGSSIGTLIVRDGHASEDEIEEIFAMEKDAVIEQLIEGTEATVPVLDQSALTPLEIRPPAEGEFDYENKYNGLTAELCPPESITHDVQEKIKELAEQVHQVMEARHLSRVDIMLDKNNQPYVLEINTMPGMTNQSLFPKSAAAAGMDMPTLVKKFVDMVVRDFKVESE